MGACVAKLTINDDLKLLMETKPDPAHLLSLQLHYDSYDSKSKKIIDQCTQMMISNNLHLEITQLAQLENKISH